MTVTRTPRLGLVRWDSDNDPWSREDLVETIDQLDAHAARFDQGLATARPPAALERRLYLASDTGRVSLDTSAAWRDLATLDTANTWDQPQTFTGPLIANGGIAPADGTLELTADLALSGRFGANGATPQAKAAATAGIKATLVSVGLLTGGGATPLDLDGGALTTGNATHNGTLTVTGLATFDGGIKATDGIIEVTGGLAVSGDVTVGGQSVATDADLTAHVSATGAHAAAKISNVPAGNIAATDVQAALNELDAEKAPKAGPTFTGLTTVVDLTATGTVRLGDAATDTIGFYGATPVARPGTYNLTGSVDRTLGAYASNAQGSTYAAAVEGTDAEAKLADLNTLRGAYENLRTYVEDLAGVVVGTATDLKALGLVG